MEKITNKIAQLNISNNIKREKIYQINGINYNEKHFYKLINQDIMAKVNKWK